MKTATTKQQPVDAPKGKRRIGVIAGAVLLAAATAVWAAVNPPKQPIHGTVTAGNSIYRVHVQDISGAGVGLYTATTGPGHPAGEGLNVLFGGGFPGTTFNTIRSYTSNTDYVQDDGKSSSNTNVFLDPFGVVTPLGATGFRTTYTLAGTPDTLTIIQYVKVNGTTFEDSSVEVTTTVINNGASAVDIGIRYLWDYQVGTDDGPTFQSFTADQVFVNACDLRLTEFELVDPDISSYRIEDNDVNPSPPTFSIFGTVTGPDFVTPVPTPPDLLQYACWPSSFSTAFEYTVNPERDIATVASDCQSGMGGGDTAVLYFFGRDRANALRILPGSSATVSASMFLTPPGGIDLQPDCITRTARFWFTHPESDDTNCVTLLKALEVNCDGADLGFLSLPLGYRNDDDVRDAFDAMIEALGLYFRSTAYTGELGGSQSQQIRASRLCRDRKRLATELIAALANRGLLGTEPEDCTYLDGGTTTNFPATLLEEAQASLAGEDVDAIRAMNVLLRKFNFSGLTNDLPGELTECSPADTRMLRAISRDPTSQFSCPAINESCATAEAIIFPAPTSIFGQPRFQSGANFNRFPNQEAWWKITADVAVSNRTFTVDTFGSNFDTLLTVFSGNCLISTNNGVPVANASALVNVGSNDNADLTPQSKLTFKTTGGQTYYIQVTGGNGRVRFHATSP